MERKFILIGSQILLLVIFSVINIGLVVSKGICCGDDAYHAMVAKNLADGHGYASSLPLLSSHSTWLPFDPYLGTGPSIILPAALLIKLAGNTYWAPGITNIILWTALLLCIGILLNKLFRYNAWLSIAAIAFIGLAVLFTAYHFEEWYALLGEIPVALLVVLGVLFYFLPISRTNLLIVGLLFSLAFEAKVVAFLPFGTLILLIAIQQFFIHRDDIKSLLIMIGQRYLWIGIGFATPVALFELYRLISLQPGGYINYWKKSLGYIGSEGVVVSQGIWAQLTERIGTASGRFGIYLPIIFAILIGTLLVIRKDQRLSSIYAWLLSIATIYTIYWLGFSVGWARYYIIPLILIIFILSLPFLSVVLKPAHKAVYALVLVGLILYNIKTIDTLYPFKNNTLFRPTTDTLALVTVGDMLASKTSEKPFLTEWWATAIDVEYIMKSALNFTTLNDPNNKFDKPYIVVVNSKFTTSDFSLDNFEKQCSIAKIGGYYYLECIPQNVP